MGLKCGHVINYVVNDLSFNDILEIMKLRCLRRNHINGSVPIPTVDIDASWIVRKCISLNYDQRVVFLIQLSLLFLKSNCAVTIVCDNNKRHHSKRSTMQRMAQRHRMTLDHQRYKCLLLSCSSMDMGKRSYLEKEIKLLEKK